MLQIEKTFETIAGYRQEVVRLQTELTARPALGPENGGTGEHEKTAFIRGVLEELKPESIREIQAPDARAREGYRPNLVARWNGQRSGPVVWVLSHSDIVPPGDGELWAGDPYRVRVDGERLIGRGVEDNQHGLVSSILALRGILESGGRPLLPVGLVVVADEETGSRYGLAHLLESRPPLFQPADLIIVPDAGNEEGTMIEVAEKSMLWLRFTVLGRQCHASTPARGKNSLLGAARLILALQELKDRFDLVDELYRPPASTFEPTKMEGNVPNVNTIPGRAVFYLDCRVLPRYEVDEVLAAGREIGAESAAADGLEVQVEAVYRQDAPPPTAADALVVKTLSHAIRAVTGKKAEVRGIGGGTVAAFFRRAGLPAAVWSTASNSAHQPNEFCRIPDVIQDARIFAHVFCHSPDPL